MFHDAGKPHLDERAMRWFVGAAAADAEPARDDRADDQLLSPAHPGASAPTDATWGSENRTTALRVIPGSPKYSAEFRIAAADPNPYVILSAALASGLWGIENRGRAGGPGDRQRLRSQVSGAPRLPRTLWDAAQRLKASKMARDWFGNDFVEHYSATREWEEREFRKHISDWELARYFEII